MMKRYMEALTYYKNKFNLELEYVEFLSYGPRMRKNDRVIPNFLNQSLKKKILLFMEMESK